MLFFTVNCFLTSNYSQQAPILFFILPQKISVMKNVLLAFNIVLLLLVGFLYYQHYGNKKSNVEVAAYKEVDSARNDMGSKIAYIDLDSLQNNYGYYKKLKGEFEKKQSSANNEITNMQKKFQKRATDLQQKAPTMTPQEQENAMQEINKMQNDLQMRKQNIDNDLFEYNAQMKDDILEKIQDFLKDYNSDGRYSYIFSYEPGFMFYKDSTLDITADVIKGLNARNSAQKK